MIDGRIENVLCNIGDGRLNGSLGLGHHLCDVGALQCRISSKLASFFFVAKVNGIFFKYPLETFFTRANEDDGVDVREGS